jgi:hypothetical protein
MIYMGQKGEVRKQRPATRVGRAQRVYMYNELSVFRGKTQRLPRGEARAAKSPLLGGDRLHHQVHRFLKIKTGPETVSVWLLVLPHPHSNAEVCPSSPKQIQSNSNQHPSLKKDKQEEKKENHNLSLPCQCALCEELGTRIWRSGLWPRL